MKVSESGLDFIRSWEGFRAEPYRDVAGVWTVGFGHTKTLSGGRSGKVERITRQEAEALFSGDIVSCEKAVSGMVPAFVKGHEFDALVSLAYNIGCANFRRSTLLRRLEKGNRKGAADAFSMWNKARIDGVLRVVPGLVRRRHAERMLFLKGTVTMA